MFELVKGGRRFRCRYRLVQRRGRPFDQRRRRRGISSHGQDLGQGQGHAPHPVLQRRRSVAAVDRRPPGSGQRVRRPTADGRQRPATIPASWTYMSPRRPTWRRWGSPARPGGPDDQPPEDHAEHLLHPDDLAHQFGCYFADNFAHQVPSQPRTEDRSPTAIPPAARPADPKTWDLFEHVRKDVSSPWARTSFSCWATTAPAADGRWKILWPGSRRLSSTGEQWTPHYWVDRELDYRPCVADLLAAFVG